MMGSRMNKKEEGIYGKRAVNANNKKWEMKLFSINFFSAIQTKFGHHRVLAGG
jgi:hypothetical protein